MSFDQSTLVLIYGTDEYLASKEVATCLTSWGKGQPNGPEVREIDGDVPSSQHPDVIRGIVQELQQGDLFSSSKIVWVRDATFLSGATSETKEALAVAQASLTDTGLGDNRLILTAKQVDRRSRFFKWIKEEGTIHVYDRPEKAYQLEEYARNHARAFFEEQGLPVENTILEAFVERAGTQIGLLEQETVKLATYLDGRKPEINDIRAIVVPTRESAIWDLADAVGEQHLPEALKIIERLVAHNEAPVGIMMMLRQRLRELMAMKICLRNGWAVPEGSGRFTKVRWHAGPEIEEQLLLLGKANPKTMHPFRQGVLAQQSQRFKLQSLQRLMKVAATLHIQLLSQSLPVKLQLDMMALQLIHLSKS